jgi:hypothetical protein
MEDSFKFGFIIENLMSSVSFTATELSILVLTQFEKLNRDHSNSSTVPYNKPFERSNGDFFWDVGNLKRRRLRFASEHCNLQQQTAPEPLGGFYRSDLP